MRRVRKQAEAKAAEKKLNDAKKKKVEVKYEDPLLKQAMQTAMVAPCPQDFFFESTNMSLKS